MSTLKLARSGSVRRRGAAAAAILIVLVALQLAITLSVLGGARGADLSAQRAGAIRAFYAAEGGMSMALREIDRNSDEDGDGGIGSISADANPATGPVMSFARVNVTRTDAGGTATLVARGAMGETLREVRSQVTLTSAGGGPGVLAEWWPMSGSTNSVNAAGWSGTPTRTEVLPLINMSPTVGGVPMWPGGPTTNGAARFSGFITVPQAGSWTFTLESDDGSRLYFNGQQAINNDGAHSMTMRTGTETMPATPVPFEIRFFNNGGPWGCRLYWQGPGVPSRVIVPPSAFSR